MKLSEISDADIDALNKSFNKFGINSVVPKECYAKENSNYGFLMDDSQNVFTTGSAYFFINVIISGVKKNLLSNIWSPIWTINYGYLDRNK